MIPSARTRKRIFARRNKRCSTVYLLLLEKKKRKVFNSIMDDVSNWCYCIA